MSSIEIVDYISKKCPNLKSLCDLVTTYSNTKKTTNPEIFTSEQFDLLKCHMKELRTPREFKRTKASHGESTKFKKTHRNEIIEGGNNVNSFYL